MGLAKFADKHWDIFGRIQLIRLKKGVDGGEHFYRLDMGKTTIRNKVRGITSNEELDRIFDTDAIREDSVIHLSCLLNPVNLSNLSTQPYHF